MFGNNVQTVAALVQPVHLTGPKDAGYSVSKEGSEEMDLQTVIEHLCRAPSALRKLECAAAQAELEAAVLTMQRKARPGLATISRSILC